MANLIDWIQSTFGEKESVQDQQNVQITQGWTVTVKGVIKSFSKTDVDKSGRNPKFTYFLTVAKEDAVCENGNFELGEKVKFRVKGKQILEGLGREIKRGDRVEIKGSGIEENPRILPTSSIKLIDNE